MQRCLQSEFYLTLDPGQEYEKLLFLFQEWRTQLQPLVVIVVVSVEDLVTEEEEVTVAGYRKRR